MESQTELRLLSAAKYNIISPQGSKPNMCIVQDSLLGAYRMSLGTQKLTKEQFFNISLKIGDDVLPDVLKRIQHIRRVLIEKGKKAQCFNGKGLVSLILPDDFNYEKHNNADPQEPWLRIYKGVIYEGALEKSVIGATNNSIIQIINKEYGADRASHFIDTIQFIANNWLLVSGFTVGIKDCIIPPTEINNNGVNKKQQIRDVVEKCFIEAENIKTTTNNPNIRELRINAALSKAKDIGLKIAKDALAPTNNFLSTVNSGSKGDFFNIAQITGLLGQQNLRGQRVPLLLNNGKRSLPHYPFENLTVEQEYESRGFISSSFIHGLNPKEFYMHGMSGREGVSDTAMGTATSGYMQRRIVKLMEDIKISYDGTVRDVTGRIYQLAYSETGIDPTMTVKVNGNQEICDVSRLVDRLNMEFEKNR